MHMENGIEQIRNQQENCEVRQSLRTALRSEILSDVRSGFSNADIMKKRRISETALRMNLALLNTQGLLPEIHECPACGFRMASPDADCPRCGIVRAKIQERMTPKETLWLKVWRIFDGLWDWIDCGGYRIMMKLKARWDAIG